MIRPLGCTDQAVSCDYSWPTGGFRSVVVGQPKRTRSTGETTEGQQGSDCASCGGQRGVEPPIFLSPTLRVFTQPVRLRYLIVTSPHCQDPDYCGMLTIDGSERSDADCCGPWIGTSAAASSYGRKPSDGRTLERRTLMSKHSFLGLAACGAGTLILLAACGTSSTPGAASAGSSNGAPKGRACVILPDSASTPTWENVFRPQLTKGFKAAGYDADIQNANGDTNKFATIGDQQLAGRCGVMFIVDLEGAGIQVATKAHAQGVPVVALDRSMAGSDYFVSYNNFKIGQIQGQAIVDALKAQGKDPAKANVVYVEGDPTDPNAKTVLAAAGGSSETSL